jgi:hypothetical protein
MGDLSSPDRYSGDDLKNIGILLGNIGDIAERLPVFSAASQQQIELEYFARSNTEYAYPQAVNDWLMTRSLSAIAITICSDDGDIPTSTYEFIASSGDSIHVSRDPRHPTSTSSDAVIEDGYADSIPRISDEEINAFLLSVAAKDTEQQDIPPIGYRLEPSDLFDRLSANAISVDTTYVFEFEDSELESIFYKMTRFGSHDRLTEMYIRYKTGSDRIMSVSIDRASGLAITFEVSDPVEGISAHYPDEGDYVRLQEIIASECERILLEDGFDPTNTST